MNVYLLEGDSNIYYSEADVDLTPRLSTATFKSLNKIMFTGAAPITSTEGVEVRDSQGNILELDQVMLDESSSTIVALLKENISLEDSYTIAKKDLRMQSKYHLQGFLILKSLMMHSIMKVMI